MMRLADSHPSHLHSRRSARTSLFTARKDGVVTDILTNQFAIPGQDGVQAKNQDRSYFRVKVARCSL